MSISRMTETYYGAMTIGRYFTDCAGDMLELERQKATIKAMNYMVKKPDDGNNKSFHVRLRGRTNGTSRFEATKEYYRNKYEGISDHQIKWMNRSSIPIACATVLVAYIDYR